MALRNKVTPKVELPTLRQYKSTTNRELIPEITQVRLTLMRQTIKAQSALLRSYRINRKPPEWALDTLFEARKAGLL